MRYRKPRSSRSRERLSLECCEPRHLMAGDTHMAVGMNLENVVDWSPAWVFTDAFKSSRPWITQAFNTATWETTWDAVDGPPLTLDDRGNPTALATWQNASGQTIRQMAGTLMFRGLGGGYAGGRYRAEWDGTGTVTFGFDAEVVATGTTAGGRTYADLQVTPSDDGIFLRIEATSPTDPVRDINVWMPDWEGRSFAGQQWQPGAAGSPFHPLFLERLAPFQTLRFMAMQETNSSDIRTWSDRRTADDVRQGSGPAATANEPTVNGMSVEYMVQLANDLDADAWFNMPHMADDGFVRNFATYVRDHLEPGRTAYVEWSNEIWNFGWGFEASHWVAQQASLPQSAGLDHWQVAGREAKRDLDIWSDVFAGQTDRLVRVAAGWAAVDWVSNRVAESMAGSFDAIAIAPYITPTDEQRDSYSAATTVDRVLVDARANVATSIEWVANHARLARDWSNALGRPIRLVAYEGGPHLDGRGEPYQNAFHAATNDPRMADIYRDYLRGLDAAGMDLYLDFQFTGGPEAGPWGDFAKLHRMDAPLATAWNYNAVVAAADGSLWGSPPSPPPAVVTLSVVDATAAEAGVDPGTVRFTRSGGDISRPLTVTYTVAGTAAPGVDYASLPGTVTFHAGSSVADLAIMPIDDAALEPAETVAVALAAGPGYTAGATTRGTVTITSDDRPPLPVVTVSNPSLVEGNLGQRVMTFTIFLSARSRVTVNVRWATSDGTATAGRDYVARSGLVSFLPGQVRKTVGVLVRGDRVAEADETLFFNVAVARNATVSSTAGRGTGTIRNDDIPATLAAAFATFGTSTTSMTTKKPA